MNDLALMLHDSPRNYGVPHDTWRPSQYELFKQIQAAEGKVVIGELGTGSGKCISTNSYVETIHGRKLARECNSQDSVKSFSSLPALSASSFPVVNKITNTHDTKVRDCIKLTTKKGYSLICTKEHKILCWNESAEFIWIKAGDIVKQRENIFLPISAQIFPANNPKLNFTQEINKYATNQKIIKIPKQLDIELAYFLGIVIGDGSMRSGKNSIKVTTADKEIVASIKSICKRFSINFSIYTKPFNRASDFSINSKSFRNFLIYCGCSNKKSIEKTIPWTILSGQKEIQSAFLRGLFDTDGHVAKIGNIEYSTSSPTLAEQVHLMLLSFGIIANVAYRPKTRSYRFHISGKSVRTYRNEINFNIQRKEIRLEKLFSKNPNPNDEAIPYVISDLWKAWTRYRNQTWKIYGRYNGVTAIDRFNQNSNYELLHRLREKRHKRRKISKKSLLNLVRELERYSSNNTTEKLKNIANFPTYFDTLESVEEIGAMETVDFEVFRDHNYNANGFTVHNSAIAAAMGHKHNVLVVCHTLGLLDQYRNLYDFSIIKGRQEYACMLSPKVSAWASMYNLEPTAADCHFSPMFKCEAANECPYLIAKNRALTAKRAACTYRYIGVSRLMKERVGDIVFDEAHDAAEELIRFNEFAYLFKTLKKYKLPSFPIKTYGDGNKGATLSAADKSKVIAWLTSCATILYVSKGDDDKAATVQRRMHSRFTRMMESLYSVDWFLRVKPYEVSLKALNAVAVARQVFAGKTTKLLMSATIGDPEPLARALGITQFTFLTFPHPVPVSHRSIKRLDVERMTARNLKERPGLYKAQALKIWEWIMQMPPSWRGVILTTSYKKIEELYRHLLVPSSIVPQSRRVLHQRKGEKVSKLVDRFITDVQPGDIMIGTIQGWGSGLDLRGELARWIAIAGVPHTNPTDQYMKARRAVEGGQAYQKWVTFNQVMQACGRVSRGEIDETTDDWLPNYAALADGSALSPMAMKNYSVWFRDALI